VFLAGLLQLINYKDWLNALNDKERHCVVAEQRLRLTISFQILLFITGALSHAGYLPFSSLHFQARIAESVIAVLLTIGLAATFTKKLWKYKLTTATQVLSLLGTLVGVVMISIGVGPRSNFDYGLHTVMIILFLVALKMLVRPNRIALR